MDVLKMQVMWKGVEVLPRLRAMENDALQNLRCELNAMNGEVPLHLFEELPEVLKNKIVFPSWNAAPVTGVEAITLMVFILWVTMGERAEMCLSLCEAWPINEVLVLVDGRVISEENR